MNQLGKFMLSELKNVKQQFHQMIEEELNTRVNNCIGNEVVN